MDRNEEIVDSLLEWHRRNRRNFPWRETRDPYKVLVAEFFLQRTPADRVAAFLPEFLAKFPSPQELAVASLSHLEELGRKLGLKKRMQWLLDSMRVLNQKYFGSIPDDKRELMALPGVGEYTASAVLCFGFGRETPIVDTNVIRVLTRVFGLFEANRRGSSAVKNIALKLLPKGQAVEYNEALLDFAAIVCKKSPLCEACPIARWCSYLEGKGSA